MNDRTRNLLVAGVALAVLVALDAASMTEPLPGSQWRSLAAQETEEWSRENEEQTYLEARRAVNRDECDRATGLFQTLRTRYDDAAGGRFIADSYYWEAFCSYRAGDLDDALVLLDLASLHREARQYVPEGPSQRQGRVYQEVRDLRLRIRRQLAEQGDPDAAEDVLRQSEALLSRDREALQEAQGQLEARQREMLRSWQQEQARAERLWQEQLELFQALQDSTDIARVQERMAELLRQRSARMGLGNPVGNLERELSALADTARLRDYLANAARYSYPGVLAASPFDQLPPGMEIPVAECPDALIVQEAFTSLLALETVKMPAVSDMLAREDACSAHLRYQAVFWLGAEGSDEAWELLVEAATGHPDIQTRRWAIRSLATASPARPETGQVLVDILRGSDESDIQRMALDGIDRMVTLSHLPGDGVTRSLTEYAIDESNSEALREQVAMLVAFLIPADSAEAFFNRLDPENVKLGFLGGLAERVRTGELRAAWLLHTVEHPDQSDEVRASLLQLWAMQPAINLERLDALYEDLENAELRDQLLYSLYLKAQSDEESLPGAADRVIDKMIELARKETDPVVRRRAIYWLGRTGSERAAEFLMEILREESNRPPGEQAP